MVNYITCTPTGVHPGYKRFSQRTDRPEVKAWRCELTALSRIYNIFFLACNDTIHVYRPSFPDQNLSSEPQLVLCLPVSPQTGSGIDPQDPHSVTRILVDYLGCDEILLVACDDGDVVGYRIDEIQRSLISQTPSTEGSPRSLSEEETVRHFLHRNVGASAWGLAVHRAARIIAISANTHRITVLAFALSEPLQPCSECPLDTVESESIGNFSAHAEKYRYSRKEDLTFELWCETNIPAVSFNNTGDDPSGHWLISCSIDGATTVWDLHTPAAPYAVFRFGFCASALNPSSAPRLGPGQCACIDSGNVPHGVWGALPLDTRSAYEITVQELDSLQPSIIEPCFKIFSRQGKQFTNGRPKRTVFEKSPNRFLPDDADSDDVMVLDDDSEVGSSTSGAEKGPAEVLQLDTEASAEEVNQSRGVGFAAIVAETITTSHTHQASSNSTLPSDSTIGTGSPQSVTGPPWSQIAAAAEIELMLDDTDMSDENGSDLESVNDEEYWPHLLAGHTLERRAYCEISTRVPILDRPFATPIRPCLIVTKEEIYLIERPCPPSRLHPPDSIITMRRPLHPGNSDPYLAPYDRLCYLSQIPELGIFIVASPIGRAAVFSLYYTKQTSKSEPAYGFNLEYLLPFDPNDDTELINVPNARLLGIAVSPVQGMSDTPKDPDVVNHRQKASHSRRWRLMMYYTDHTVLGFELSKRSQDATTPDVSELVL